MFADALRHHQAGRLVDAARRYRRILSANPRDYPEVHMNLGLALLQQGKLDEAATTYKEALELRPNDVEGLLNLGNILGDLGKPDEAIACYRKALVVSPDFPDVHNSLGATLYGLGMLDEAVARYHRALEIRPDFVMALNNLAATLMAQGKSAAALNIARRALQIEETDETKGLLVSCLSRARGVTADAGLRPLMVRALSEHWGWPSSLMPVCIDLIRLDHDITGQASFDAAALSADSLLPALLDAAPICDVGMERFLTAARRALLDTAPGTSRSEDGIGFYSALARQCFINEYVFAITADETRRANDLGGTLSAALETDAAVPSLWLPAVAAYFPLCSLPLSARLLERSWPAEIMALLTQQVREPAEERRIGAAIPRLTAIEDDVSLLVQRQYEENPYPRWVRVPPSAKANGIEAYLRRTFPLAAFDRPPASSRMEILVAGCGTGQQSIRTSRQFPEARILAIDLSRSSLAYAMRKTRELSISSIEYAQADLLKLGSLGRQFDVIQAGGVLHHLADPWTGWRTLMSLLRPGGFMLLGLYSRIARRDVTRLRQSIAEQGYGTTADEIRRCRQDLMAAGSGIGSADGRPSDLFTISGFRDLLFHVQEHPVTLTELESFLEENNLAFLAFDISADVLQSYRSRFPQDRAATNLAQWQVFENENPDTFVGMYQFWIQRRR
jgi:tetratricopeptide (TPR) repeat protein/2-polyprenyl-3-methyl-5-hydroxy-6-metoxy-1,4-benzoquinol methylase